MVYKIFLFIFIFLFSSYYAQAETDKKATLNDNEIISIYNQLMDKEYIIRVKDFNNINNIYKSLSDDKLKALSIKYQNDIDRYVNNLLKYVYNFSIDAFYYSGINSIYTINTIKKYFSPEIKENYIKISAKDFYNDTLKEEYADLANAFMKYISLDKAAPQDDKEYEDNLFGFMQLHAFHNDGEDSEESESEKYYAYSDICYQYKLKKPVTIKGIFTLSNTNNNPIFHENYPAKFYINRYLPKTEFTSFDKTFELNRISIRPKKFTYGSNIYPNILENGLIGEINFEAEITISPESSIYLNKTGYDNNAFISVDEVKLNKILSSFTYRDIAHNYLDYKIKEYQLSSSDGFVNIRNAPNGKIIKTIKLNNEDVSVYHNVGLYNFEEKENQIFAELNDDNYTAQFKGYYDKINKLLNMKDLIIGDWYKVIYIPKDIKENVITGYIYSSQLKKL